jgi:hypothetical protein
MKTPPAIVQGHLSRLVKTIYTSITIMTSSIVEDHMQIERRLEMDRSILRRRYSLFAIPILVLLLGCLIGNILTISTLSSYPSLIKEAYCGPLQKIEIPGEAEVDLHRKGAYGVYFETANVPPIAPPMLDCRLASKTSGEDVPLVPDYVPTNRYSTQGGRRVGVLIYSTTIKDPGLHTLSCDYADGKVGSKQALAIGPNYYFEFLRVAWNMAGSLLRGVGVLLGSVVLSIGIVIFLLLGSRYKRAAAEANFV